MIQLRPYQVDIIESARSKMRSGVKSILIQSPCGSGKTILTAHMLKTAAEKKMPSLFIVHRRELIHQTMRAFDSIGVDYGVISSGFKTNSDELIQIAGIQSLSRRHYKTPKLIVWDESAHIAAKSWSGIYKKHPHAFHIGITATPERLDGRGLNDYFQEMVTGPSVQWLIENNYLSTYRLYAPSTIDTSNIHKRMGDFVKSELVSAANKPTITGNAIREYQKLAPGKRAVVFCVSIEHSKDVVSQFQAAGIPSAHVDGETNVNERDSTIEMFKSGEIRVLSNVDLFGEGFDLPAIEVAILLRPTASLGLFIQQTGRALRTSPEKTQAIILDHAGNTLRHGFPDEERTWSLLGRNGRKQSATESIRICPTCFAAMLSGTINCKYCGFLFPPKPREIEQCEGELSEVDTKRLLKTKRVEQGRAQTLQDLIAIGKSRQYRNPYAWASFVFRGRQAKKLGYT